MKMRLHWLPLAALLLPMHAFAQSAHCPQLPGDSGMHWESSEGPAFLYCKAVRETDGSQAFAVTLRTDSNFRSRFALREERAVIDGHEVRWYRGDVPASNGETVLETEIELDDDLYAHIFLRARSPEEREQAQRLAEGIRFGSDVRLGSN